MASKFRWIGQSPDGQTVTLQKFNGEFRCASYFNSQWQSENEDLIRTASIIDVETTGLDRKRDQIIEIGIRQFRFNRKTGEALELTESISELQDPGVPLTDIVQRVTGLTDAMLEGKSIDWSKVNAVLEQSDVIVAHNAGFDRPFVDAKSEVSQRKPWACSLRQVDWEDKGFNVQKLEMLCIYHGFYTDSHRALNDCDALMHLLSFTHDRFDLGQHPYFLELLKNARRSQIQIYASHSPFESKDDLKARGYRWNTQTKTWTKTLFKEQGEDEVAWLESVVYNGEFRGRVEEISLVDHFKS